MRSTPLSLGEICMIADAQAASDRIQKLLGRGPR
jgi:hypothetical protein